MEKSNKSIEKEVEVNREAEFIIEKIDMASSYIDELILICQNMAEEGNTSAVSSMLSSLSKQTGKIKSSLYELSLIVNPRKAEEIIENEEGKEEKVAGDQKIEPAPKPPVEPKKEPEVPVATAPASEKAPEIV
jgi:hypothetical protein